MRTGFGADEDEAAFRDKQAVIARQKPKDEPKCKCDKKKSWLRSQ